MSCIRSRVGRRYLSLGLASQHLRISTIPPVLAHLFPEAHRALLVLLRPRSLVLSYPRPLFFVNQPPSATMRFASALFASLAAQAVVAGLLPSIPSTTGVKSLDTGLSVVHSVHGSVEAEGEAIGTF